MHIPGQCILGFAVVVAVRRIFKGYSETIHVRRKRDHRPLLVEGRLRLGDSNRPYRATADQIARPTTSPKSAVYPSTRPSHLAGHTPPPHRHTSCYPY
ncbi:hypothetical protein M513_04305 [Trichuris suis]|uniref:Uncharacterized protein n=1 Tax=Trichuris suis TaxID=68888 RepID=A0A085MCC5_9BILA|nr:hypothetical protein M513_04305 [Trichuris suis]